VSGARGSSSPRAADLPAVVTVVSFAVAGPPPSTAALRELLERTAPRYRAVPGLLRKLYVGADGIGGGVYEWRSRADAEAWFDARWHAQMRAAYGVEPQVEWFDVACVVDNVRGAIELGDLPP
jgi:hypothetical protein